MAYQVRQQIEQASRQEDVLIVMDYDPSSKINVDIASM